MAAEQPDDADVLLTATNVSRAFVSAVETVQAVDDVSLTLRAGQFICIYGASGSGKSTLLSIMAGLEPMDSGDVTVGSTRVGDLDESGRAQLRLERLGVIFQGDNLIDEFTAVENVALPLEVRGVPSAEAFTEAAMQLSRVGLAGLEARRPVALSGGQRQRVGVARALIGNRRVLLADEPTGALDSKNSYQLFLLIRELCNEGMSAVVCSHDMTCRDFADVSFEMIDGVLHERSAGGQPLGSEE